MAEPHKLECARSLRRRGLADGWDEERIATAIQEHCGVTMLRAHRLARGWTLQDVATELRSVCIQEWGTEPAVSHQRVSRWENGADTPSTRYLEGLCRLYRSRPDRLGFGRDYTEPRLAPPARCDATPREFPLAGTGGVTRPAADTGSGHLEPSDAAPGLLSAHLLTTLRDTRDEADALLEAQSVSAATVDRWEQMAEDYRCQLFHQPLDVFLPGRLHDVRQLRGILAQRQPLEFQTRLYRVMAQLAGQIGFTLMGLGALRESLDWSHTARLAADEIDDRRLRAWLTAWEALTYFWDPNLTGRAVALCETAQLMAGSSPTAPGAFAASLQARSYARLGRRREALDAMHKAESMSGRLGIAETGPTRFAFDEQRMWYDRQNSLTRLGEIEAAEEAREHAQRLTTADMNIDPVLIQLDQASCLITANDTDEGCALALRTLSGTTHGAGGGVMWLRALEIDDMCRSRGIRTEPAYSLHQMVTHAAEAVLWSRSRKDGRRRNPEMLS